MPAGPSIGLVCRADRVAAQRNDYTPAQTATTFYLSVRPNSGERPMRTSDSEFD